MIPKLNSLDISNFQEKEKTSKDHKLNYSTDDLISKKKYIYGEVDELQAMEQVVYKILNTQRYQSIIYSWDYGIELEDLKGKSVTYVCAELERRIYEALTFDNRITNVLDFNFDVSKIGIVSASFKVETIFGQIKSEKNLNIK